MEIKNNSEVELKTIHPGHYFVFPSEYDEITRSFKVIWKVFDSSYVKEWNTFRFLQGELHGVICIAIPAINCKLSPGIVSSFRSDLKVIPVKIKRLEMEFLS